MSNFSFHIFFCLTTELTQTSANCIVMVALDKPSIANIQRAKDFEKLKKFFNLSLLRGKDQNTYIRAIACSLLQHGYVTLGKGAEVANVKREDVTNVKALV